MRRIKIGTRASRLAFWQAQFVAAELKKIFPALEIELVKVRTTGDKNSENFYTQAVKALFTDEEAKIFAKN